MLKFSLVFGFLTLLTSVAAADQIMLTNDTDDTIYKLYAWPMNLSPRTMNIIGFPLSPGASTSVDVDNSYGDCIFQFETDANSPADAKKPHHKNRPADFHAVNLCQLNGKVSLKPTTDDDL